MSGVSGSGFEWIVRPTVAWAELAVWQREGLEQALRAIAYFYANEIQNWMKANGSWQDQTGNARQALYAIVDELVTEIVIEFGHGMFYGKYLEFKHMGRYAIVAPALDHFIPLIWKAVQQVVQ